MRYFYSFFLLLAFQSGLFAQTLAYQQVEFWLGSGTDTTLLVVDFKDGLMDSSYVWGYLHDGTASGEDLLNAVAAADINFQLNIDTASFGNFLQDLTYHRHSGLGGSPDYWGTWDANDLDLANFSANAGIGSALISGGMFGCSYTDFNPAVAPGAPWAAYNPNQFLTADVKQWLGQGQDSAVVIIDFAQGDTSSFAWGLLFNDSIDYYEALDTLAAYDNNLIVNRTSSNIMKIKFGGDSGSTSATSDWLEWRGSNLGDWQPVIANYQIKAGNWLGLRFGVFNNLQRPAPPEAANFIGLKNTALEPVAFFPNPSEGNLYLQGAFAKAYLSDQQGRTLQYLKAGLNQLNLPAGSYLLTTIGLEGTAQTAMLILR